MMSLTQDKPRFEYNFTNNNDLNYLHKKFKKMASTIAVPPSGPVKRTDNQCKDTDTVKATAESSISNGSIAAAHPEIEKIKEIENENLESVVEKNVQTIFKFGNCRLGEQYNTEQKTGETSCSDDFLNKTENFENNVPKEIVNGGTAGRYICPYCKLSCAKPSVLQKHIRAHTNERPYPCVPCGFAFKTKSNLYKHRRSRTHALRLQGGEVTQINEEEWSGESESDTSLPSNSASDAGSEAVIFRIENSRPSDYSSPELVNECVTPPIYFNIPTTLEGCKIKTIYKPKFRATLYKEGEEREKNRKNYTTNADFLNEHISKIISDNEAIVDVLETPLQKKYGKIKQIAESKQLLSSEVFDSKPDSIPLNLTKNSSDMDIAHRKRSHSESFSQTDNQKHPLNPEGSIIKDLLLKTKVCPNGLVTGEALDGTGSLYICPLCQIPYRSADNLDIHRTYYCKGTTAVNTVSERIGKDSKVLRLENVYVRSNSVNVKLPETQADSTLSNFTAISLKSPPLRNNKPDNLVITKTECNEIVTPLPSPGPLLGNTRLIDSRVTSELSRNKFDNFKPVPTISPKRRLDNRSDSFSPRHTENTSPRIMETFAQSKIRCIDGNTTTLRSLEELSQSPVRQNSTSLQMFGGEVKIVDHSGGTTTLRIEPSKSQLSPILIHQSLSPSKLMNDTEASSVVVRSGLHSGGTIVHNPPTPKECKTSPRPQTPRITLSVAPGLTTSNLTNISSVSHFQFPPLGAITAFNPLTLPPLSPTISPNGATTIIHGGKLIPHVPGMPGPNTSTIFIGSSNVTAKYTDTVIKTNSDLAKNDIQGNFLRSTTQKPNAVSVSRFEIVNNSEIRGQLRSRQSEDDKNNTNNTAFNTDHGKGVLNIPTIKIKHVVEQMNVIRKTVSPIKSLHPRNDNLGKRNIENQDKMSHNHNEVKKIKTNISINNTLSSSECKVPEIEVHNFNFETLITKAEIFNKQICSSTHVEISNIANDSGIPPSQFERSETSYFQKNSNVKPVKDDKPKFLRPSTLPLKPGTFTPKKHHGITPNANTIPLVSPETPRPAKAYGQLYLNGNAYTYLGLKCSTKVFYCTINRPQPTYVPNQHFLSMYSNWQLLSELTPDPLGLSTTSAMSLYDSRHRPQSVTIAKIKQDLILTHSSQWNNTTSETRQKQSLDNKKSEDNKLQCIDTGGLSRKELAGGFESNEEYTYVRGRGRGRYVCSECGIRCKKPSMLKKHIRTHTDVRPYTCTHCAFSFKTKGNLTKHMKSKAHYKKCCELGINPNEGTDMDIGDLPQGMGETDEESDSDGDDGNEGETESSDTETCKSRLPEHEAAHCLLSLWGTRPATSATPGLITSARPSTYPYTPTGQDSASLQRSSFLSEPNQDDSNDSKMEVDNEPIDLSKSETKIQTFIAEIPTARESSVLASLASNTAKLPQHQAQWANGEPMLHAYLTERALLDSKIKQSQLSSNVSKLRKQESGKVLFEDTNNTSSYSTICIQGEPMIVKSKSPSTLENVVTSSTRHYKSNNENISQALAISIANDLRVETESVVLAVTEPQKEMTKLPETSTNTDNAKFVVSEYLKLAQVSSIETKSNPNDNSTDNFKSNTENLEKREANDNLTSDLRTLQIDHDPVARKVVIGAGGIAFKVSSKGKDFENAPTYTPGRLMEDGRRVCDFCNKTFTKPSQLRLHLNIHYMERPFRCSACAVSFRTRGHLQKHERSGSHHNKVSMTSTFGAATSLNPRPFRCSDCNIAFRIHGHLAKHLRSKMHVMRLECLFKLPFGTFTEIERAGVSLTDIDTTDCASSLASLQVLAQKLHEKDPTKLEFPNANMMGASALSGSRESSDDEDGVLSIDKFSECEKDSEHRTTSNNDGVMKERNIYSATDN